MGNIQLNTIINRNLDITLLINIYYYLGLDVNFILFNKFEQNGIRYIINNSLIIGYKNKEPIFKIIKTNNIYILN